MHLYAADRIGIGAGTTPSPATGCITLSCIEDIKIYCGTGSTDRTYIEGLEVTGADVKTTPGRALDTVYQNTTNYPKLVVVSVSMDSLDELEVYVEEGDSSPDVFVANMINLSGVDNITNSVTFIVPIDAYYEVAVIVGVPVLLTWHETTIGW